MSKPPADLPQFAPQYLATIVQNADDAIVSKDLDSIVTSWNPAAARIFGYTEDEMIGQSILRIVPLELAGEENEIVSRIRRGERIDHFETKRRRKEGTVAVSGLPDSWLIVQKNSYFMQLTTSACLHVLRVSS